MTSEKHKKLYKRHLRAAFIRSGVSLAMWTIGVGAFFVGALKAHHLVGISISVIYLILINPPTLIVLKKIAQERTYEKFSLLINLLEIIGYTSVIYFCGDIEATYLTLIYAALIAYVGVVAPQKHSFIIASFCATIYCVMFVLIRAGLIPHLSQVPNSSSTLVNQILIILVVIGFLYIVAYISATSAHILKQHKEKLKQQNVELTDANKNLKHEIQQRIQTEGALRESEERLARSEKMKALGLLAGGVAHDLNNVLSGIVSYPDLLLMDIPEDSPLKEPILTIKESGKKAATIVQDLLTLARRGVTTTEVLNFNDIVSDYLGSPEHKKFLNYHPDVIIEKNLAAELPHIQGSAVHIKKTVMNLVSNAAEALPQGGKIIVSTENQYIDRPIKGYDHVHEGEYVVVKVKDNGTGIAPDDLKRIFEPFYTKKVMGRSGTGLGMTVVWGTVQDHNGYINVESTEGKGTTFELYFPLTRGKNVQQKYTKSIEDYRGNNESILVIDDVKEQREIAAKILKKLNYNVATVSSGEDAVNYMKSNFPDLLVLDMIMDPGIDGLETYKRIVKLNPGQKAIIVSGFAETERVKEAQRLGAGEYIKKPYMMDKIGRIIRVELNKL
jgi:signal transduction histidine kinase